MTQYFNRHAEKEERQRLRHSMPKAEVLLWVRLKGRQLLGCKFRRQYSVGPYVIDFYCPAMKLAIELDGDSHFQAGAKVYDAERQAFIESFGIRVLRFLNTDIYENMDGVLEVIVRGIHELLAKSREPGASEGESEPPPCPPSEGGES